MLNFGSCTEHPMGAEGVRHVVKRLNAVTNMFSLSVYSVAQRNPVIYNDATMILLVSYNEDFKKTFTVFLCSKFKNNVTKGTSFIPCYTVSKRVHHVWYLHRHLVSRISLGIKRLLHEIKQISFESSQMSIKTWKKIDRQPCFV